ncbi:hypothetical protein D9M71_575340 [compost metagenome]
MPTHKIDNRVCAEVQCLPKHWQQRLGLLLRQGHQSRQMGRQQSGKPSRASNGGPNETGQKPLIRHRLLHEPALDRRRHGLQPQELDQQHLQVRAQIGRPQLADFYAVLFGARASKVSERMPQLGANT